LLGLLAISLPGCVAKPLKAANSPKSQSTPLPKGVEGKGISVNWLENMPNGTVRPVLDIKAATGSAATGSRSGKFHQAEGFIYQKGKRVLQFEAPAVNATEEKKTVLASGRVKAWSIDPPGVTVEADRVTWKIEKNKVIAEGAVTLTYQRPGDARPIAWGQFAHMTIDTELKKFTVP
jgi:hypothetical protein